MGHIFVGQMFKHGLGWMEQVLSWVGRLGWVLGIVAIVGMTWPGAMETAIAAPDPYVTQYLKVQRGETAMLQMDQAGTMQEFTYDALLEGKELFGQNCLSCHVGGTTLSSPEVSLALTSLKGANPPLDTVNALVTYMRHPISYDGSDENFSCREITEDWLSQPEVEKMGAFVLRAAQYAKGWGTARF